MGLLGFGKKKADPWDKIFKNCDFSFARNEIISQLTGGVYKKEMTELLDAFINNPTKATAIKLITYNKDFTSFFYNNISRRTMMQSRGIDTNQPIKSVNLLMQESDFEVFCQSIDENIEKYTEIQAKYLSNGYTQSMIDEAFAKYWKDLSSDTF
jgi:hypothetical protein